MRQAFLAWKQEQKNQHVLGTRLVGMMESLRNLSTQSAFDLIKRYAAESHSRKGEHKVKGRARLIRAFANFFETKERSAFNKWRQWRDKCRTRDKKMKAVIQNIATSRFRSYFLTWKDKAF